MPWGIKQQLDAAVANLADRQRDPSVDDDRFALFTIETEHALPPFPRCGRGGSLPSVTQGLAVC